MSASDPNPARSAVVVSSSRRTPAMEIVRDHTVLSVGAALLPIPLVDGVVVTGIQWQMCERLAQHYGYAVKWGATAHWATVGGVGLGHHLLTRSEVAQTLGGAVAAVPLVGRALRIFSWPALLASLTWTLGKACVDHYESGGGPLPWDQLLHKPFPTLGRPGVKG